MQENFQCTVRMHAIMQLEVVGIGSILRHSSSNHMNLLLKLDIKCIIQLPIEARLQIKLCISRWNSRNRFNLMRGKLAITIIMGVS